MARKKRSSMREGPLADLFRSTTEPQPDDAASADEVGANAASDAAASAQAPVETPAPASQAPSADTVAAEPARTPAPEVDAPAPVVTDDYEVTEFELPPSRPLPKERLSKIFADDYPDLEGPAFGRDEPGHSTAGGRPVSTHPHAPVIRVVGVGGAGVNAVNRMVESGLQGVEFLAVNTDLQSLQQSTADVTVHLGSGLARGLGAGSDPELGYRAAFEEQDKIKRLLKGADLVFITAGAGGGTGTGAGPVVARLARDVGALTVGIVTRPFKFEGTRRNKQADEGIEQLATEVDTLIVIPNERLLQILARNTSMVEAFGVADDVLRQGVQGISELITMPGMINLDFADVRTTMRDAGRALLGIGMGTGDGRAQQAAEQAMSSPLLETSAHGARSILLSITGGNDLTLLEVSEAARIVKETAHPDANIIFGSTVDETLDDQIWVTVIATRFDGQERRVDPMHTGERRAIGASPGSRSKSDDGRAGSSRSRDVAIDVPEFLSR